MAGVYGTAKYGQNVYNVGGENPLYSSSGSIMWILQIDWDMDGVFRADIEPQSIKSISIGRGRGPRVRGDGRGQEQPDSESITIVMADSSRRYDQFNASSPLYAYFGCPGFLCRVLMVSTTSKLPYTPVFYGVITEMNYSAANQTAEIKGAGLSYYLEMGAASALYSPCQSLNSLATDSYFIRGSNTPYPVNYWSGRPGGLTLRAIVALVLERAGYALGGYYGLSVYNSEHPTYFYMDGDTAWNTLKGVADGFAARLFWLRDGRLFAMDRLDSFGLGYDLPPGSPQEKAGLVRANPFQNLKNRVEVSIRNHSVVKYNYPSTDVMYYIAWENSGPIEVGPNSNLEIKVKYPGGDGNVLQASHIYPNAAVAGYLGTKLYRAMTNNDGTGTNLALTAIAYISPVYEIIGQNSQGYIEVQNGNNQMFFTIRLTNNDPVLTAYFFDVQVLAIGIRETGLPATKVLEDSTSIAKNGSRTLAINSRWIQNDAAASAIGQAYLTALSDRAGASVASVVYFAAGEDLYDLVEGYDVGKTVLFGDTTSSYSLANFGLSGRWLIVGQDLTWLAPDGQGAMVKITYEKMLFDYSAAVAIWANSNGVITSNYTLSFSHTVPAGNYKILVVGVCKRRYYGYGLLSVTYGGEPMTLLAHAEGTLNTSTPRVDMYYLIDPAVGTADVVITSPNPDYMEAGAITFDNVDWAEPFRQVVTGNGTGAASVGVSSQAGDMVVDLIGYWGGAATPRADQQTIIINNTSDGQWRAGMSYQYISPMPTMQWSGISSQWAQIALVIKHI